MLIRLTLFVLITYISNLKGGYSPSKRLSLAPICPDLERAIADRPELAKIFVEGLKKGLPNQPMFNKEIEDTRRELINEFESLAKRSTK